MIRSPSDPSAGAADLLLRMKRLYAAAGFPLADGELPDYLPALLEFAAIAPPGRGDTLLVEHRLALELLRARLAQLDSPWACVLEVLCASMPGLGAIERDRLARLRAEVHQMSGSAWSRSRRPR